MASNAAILLTKRLQKLRIVSEANKPILAGLSARCISSAQSRLHQRADHFGKRLETSYRKNPRNLEESKRIGMRESLKKNRMFAQANYTEWRYPSKQRPIDISCTRMVFKEYEDKSALFSRLRDPRKELQDRRVEFFSNRAIKKRVPNFHRKRFPDEAQEIYIEAHQLLNTENWTLPNKEETEETLHGLVTEFAYSKMLQGLDKKTVNWEFIESIEPPRTVQMFTGPMMHQDNLYAQVTVRFHTKQILSLYDRFGRLMMGSPSEPRAILEYVTFERHIVDPYGRWRIHGKKLMESTNKDNLDQTIAIIRKNPQRAAAKEWHKQEEEINPHKWYPAREGVLRMQNRPFTVFITKKQRRMRRKHWVLRVKHTPHLRMKKKDLRRVARKSRRVYYMRQSGALPKPPP